MKCLIFILFPLIIFAQNPKKKDLDIYKGDSHTLSFETKDDVSSDSLLFVVKADRDDDTQRVISLNNETGGGSDDEIEVIYSTKSTILVKLTQINTEGLTAATYVYDLTVDSTTTLYTGYLKLRDEVGGSADGIATKTPYYTVALDTPTAEGSVPWGQDSDNSWDVISGDALLDSLNIRSTFTYNDALAASTNTALLISEFARINTNGGGGLKFLGNGQSDTLYINGEITFYANTHVDFSGVVIKLADDSDTTMFKSTDASNCVFKNGTLDGNMQNQTALYTAGDATTAGKYRYGIHISGGNNVKFIDMEFVNVRYGGIFINGGGTQLQDYYFIRCRFVDMGASALRLADVKNAVILTCYFEDWGWYNNSAGSGSEVWGFEHPMIQTDGALSVDYFKYIGNDAYAVSDSGFSIESARPMRGAQIIGNKFYGDYTGISGQGWINCIMVDNIFDSSSVGTWRSGFEIPGYGNIVERNIINNGAIFTGGVVGNKAHGDIDTVGCYGNSISNNYIRISVASRSAISWGVSIGSDSLYSNKCNGNTIDLTGSSSSNGIYVGQGDLGLVTHMEMVGNVIFETDGGQNNSGIRFLPLDGSDRITVKGGRLTGLNHGIQFAASDTTLRNVYVSKIYFNNNANNITGSLTQGTLHIKDCPGYETVFTTQDSIPSGGTTSGNIAHGLDYTPSLSNSEFYLVPTGTIGSASYLYIDSIDGTNVVIKSDADPSSKTITFILTIRKKY